MPNKLVVKDIDNITIEHSKKNFNKIQKKIKDQNIMLLKDICAHYNWNYEELCQNVLVLNEQNNK
mgnify:FL=1